MSNESAAGCPTARQRKPSAAAMEAARFDEASMRAALWARVCISSAAPKKSGTSGKPCKPGKSGKPKKGTALASADVNVSVSGDPSPDIGLPKARPPSPVALPEGAAIKPTEGAAVGAPAPQLDPPKKRARPHPKPNAAAPSTTEVEGIWRRSQQRRKAALKKAGAEGGKVASVRKSRCGVCIGCVTTENCGLCFNCKDMPEFGGQHARKQPCVRRCCFEPNYKV
mgnify:CR=1 FL=1